MNRRSFDYKTETEEQMVINMERQKMKMKTRIKIVFTVVCLVMSISVKAGTLFHNDFDVYPGTPTDWQDYATLTAGSAYSVSAVNGNLVVKFVNSQGTIVAAGREALPTPAAYSGSNFLYYTYDIKEIIGASTGFDMVVSQTQLTSTSYPSPEFRVTLYQQPDVPGQYKYNNRVYTYSGSTWTTKYDSLLYDNTQPYGDLGKMTLAINATNFVLYLNGTQLAAGTHGLTVSSWTESYVNLFAYTYGTGNNYAKINLVDVSDVLIPEPATMTLLSIGSLLMIRSKRNM